MSEKDELARLRGEMAALKDALIATIKAAQKGDRIDVTSPSAVGVRKPNVVESILRDIETKLTSGTPAQVPDIRLREPEERAAYTDMLVELKESLKGP